MLSVTLSAADVATLKAGGVVTIQGPAPAAATAHIVLSTAWVGIGGIYDPYFWQDTIPEPGETLFYDPKYLTIAPDGEISSTKNDVSAVVYFLDGGNRVLGLISLTSGESAHALSVVRATADLRTP